MPAALSFDLAAAHKYFAADCFNKGRDSLESARSHAESIENKKHQAMLLKDLDSLNP